MSIKVCPECRKSNAPINQNCVGCGHLMLYEKIKQEKQRRNLITYFVERLFSSVLLGCAVVSVLIAVMSLLHQPFLTGWF